MSLEIKVKQILDNFENSSSNDILEVLNQIRGTFQSKITQDYLQGKLKTILDTSEEGQNSIQIELFLIWPFLSIPGHFLQMANLLLDLDNIHDRYLGLFVCLPRKMQGLFVEKEYFPLMCLVIEDLADRFEFFE